MKHIKSLFCIILVVFMLSGCSVKFASSINDLISAVPPIGENAQIKETMDKFVSSGYSLKNPSYGDNISSYTFYDVDGDSNQEAIVFYEPNNALGSIRMALLHKSDNGWKVLADTTGEGEDVFRIDFSDIDNDKKMEILVCWNTISKSTNHTLCIYKPVTKKSKTSFKKIGDDKIINNFMVVDFSKDGNNELLLFEITSGSSSSSKAELYSLNKGRYKLLGETRLDSHITSYTKFQSDVLNGDLRIYADAQGTNGESMLTEVLYWSNMYDSIVSPFYSYSSGVTSGTTRNCHIESMDINDDKIVEIPVDKKMKGVPKNIKPLEWKAYKNTILVHSNYSLFVPEDNYTILLPDKTFKNIKVGYDNTKKEMFVTDKQKNQPVFSIMPVLKAVYNEKDYAEYSMILEDSGYYYLAKCSNNNNVQVTVDELKKYIKAC